MSRPFRWQRHGSTPGCIVKSPLFIGNLTYIFYHSYLCDDIMVNFLKMVDK